MLKQALSKIFRSQKAATAPEEMLLNALREAGSVAYNDFPFTEGIEIPCLRARRMLCDFYKKDHPVLSRFKTFINEVKMPPEQVRLDTVIGCSASKTSMSFAYMSQLGWFINRTVKHWDDVEKTAARTFEGEYDCVSAKNETIPLYRQQWDDRSWFANKRGGSHKAGAVWMIDRFNNKSRALTCDITEFRISEDFKKFCVENSIFLFESKYSVPLIDLNQNPAFKNSGLTLAPDKITWDGTDWCLVVAKDNPFHADIKDALHDGYDFTNWVLNPNDYTECETHYLPAQTACLGL